jgi:hypothetical protein
VIGVHIFDDGAKIKLQRVLGFARNPRAVLVDAAREGGNRLKKHFREKDRSEANKLGGRRTHYWNRVAQSVSAPVPESASRVVVNITDPTFAQKLFGGVIRAKRVRNLAIPQEPEAYGRARAIMRCWRRGARSHSFCRSNICSRPR